MCGINLSRNALRVPKEEEGMTYEALVLVIRPISDEAGGFQNACIRSCEVRTTQFRAAFLHPEPQEPRLGSRVHKQGSLIPFEAASMASLCSFHKQSLALVDAVPCSSNVA
jgi:hypothetical protein